MAKIHIPMTQVEFKKLHFTRGDCLVVRRPKGLDDYEWTQQLMMLGQDVADKIPFKTMVFGVDNRLSEISKVSEQQMESYGWVRRERVFAFIDEAHEQVAKKYEELAREYHASVTNPAEAGQASEEEE